MTVIDVQNVSKHFDDVVAVSALNLQIKSGEVFGFLGPNGAGKTTTIDIMLDYVRPTTGSVQILGQDVSEASYAIRNHVGILPEGAAVWDRLTGRQHIEFAIESKEATDDPDAILDRVGIAEAADRRAGGYSKGMAQRLLLGMALVGEPDLLILDEPSTGLDPNGAREMRQIVLEENERGATVFFSSHILEQVESVCDRVGIIANGEMVATDSIAGLRQSVGAGSTLRASVDSVSDAAIEAIKSIDSVSDVATDQTEDGQEIIVTGTGSNAEILSVLEENDVTVHDFRTAEASLDDVFRAYTTDKEVSQ